MSKFADKRTVGGHIKEGFKNIKSTYKAMYNSPAGGAKTGANNLKTIATGRSATTGQAVPGATRAKAAAMGAASVTPIGPIAAFAAGIKKSVQEKKADKAAKAEVKQFKAEIKSYEAAKPTFVKATKPTGPKAVGGPVIGQKLPKPPAAPSGAAPSGTASAAAPGVSPRRPAPVRGGALPPAPPAPIATRPTVMRPAGQVKPGAAKLPKAPTAPNGKPK